MYNKRLDGYFKKEGTQLLQTYRASVTVFKSNGRISSFGDLTSPHLHKLG